MQAGTAETGLKLLRNALPGEIFDLILLDLNLPEMSGLEAVKAVLAAAGATPVVVVSANEKSSDAEKILRLGARGYLLKSLPPAELLAALRQVLAGGTYGVTWLEKGLKLAPAQNSDGIVVPPRTRAVVPQPNTAIDPVDDPVATEVGSAVDIADAPLDAASPASPGEPGRIRSVARLRQTLSERQFAVLVLLCQGLGNREIGEALQIAEATVKVHLALVFRAMGVVNRTQAAVEARQMGLKV